MLKNRVAGTLIALATVVSASPALSQTTERQETSIVQQRLAVGPGQFVFHTFKVPTHYVDARVAGNAFAMGGTGNDIRVLVLSEEQFRAFRSGRPTTLLYDSGKRRSVVISVRIAGPGTYVVVFDNRFSMISAKNVEADIRFSHRGRDTKRAEHMREQVNRREQRLGEILGDLATTLKGEEKKLGTHQLQMPIYIHIKKDDGSLNAFADWRRRVIGVTRGTLECAESLPPPDGDQVLAGVLAHELAHIFYRHSFGNDDQQAAQAIAGGTAGALMIHPLVGLAVGAIAFDSNRKYDRLQEQEADILGIRLACHSGYDPSGLLIFMARVQKESPSAVSFMKRHPATVERLAYLKQEIGKLQCSPHKMGQ